jgi:L-lactate dehydrogenase complex protein LldG
MTIAERTDLIALFEGRCRRLGVVVVTASRDGVAGEVVAILRERGARSVVVADDLGDARVTLLQTLESAGVDLLAGATAREAEPAEAGVSRAHFAIAETGSLAVVGNDPQPRFATMLVPLHIALVDQSRLFASLDQAGAEIEALMSSGTRCVSLVTGPSRTADVEKTLAVGVHGPREVVVVLVEDS